MIIAAWSLDATLLFVIGLLCFVMLCVSLAQGWQFRRTVHRSAARDDRLRVREERELTAVTRSLVSELESTATKVQAEIDQRIDRLEKLLREVDELMRSPIDTDGGSNAAMTDDFRNVPALEIGMPETVSAGSVAPPQQRIMTTSGGHPRRADILAFAGEGKSPIDIATSLGLPLGEVELVMRLDHFARCAT